MEKKIRRGVAIYSYSGEYGRSMDLEDCFRDMQDMGATGIEILANSHIDSYPELSDEYLEKWNRLCSTYGIEPAEYGHWIDTRLFRDRDMNLEEARKKLINDFRIAHSLGFRILRTKMGVIDEKLAPVENWREIIRSVLPEAEKYDVVMIDETGRLALEKMKALEEYIGRIGAVCIFSFDAERLKFADADACGLYLDLVRRADRICELSGNIRINKSLASFRRYLFNRNDAPADRSFPDVELYFAHGARELRRLAAYCRGRGYRIIDWRSYENEKTESDGQSGLPGECTGADERSGLSEECAGTNERSGLSEKDAESDNERASCLMPEDLIGREYDRAAVILDSRFSYEGGHLRGGKTEEESRKNLAYLYDAVSRAREKLAVLVLDNKELLDDLLRMLAPQEDKKV